MTPDVGLFEGHLPHGSPKTSEAVYYQSISLSIGLSCIVTTRPNHGGFSSTWVHPGHLSSDVPADQVIHQRLFKETVSFPFNYNYIINKGLLIELIPQ